MRSSLKVFVQIETAALEYKDNQLKSGIYKIIMKIITVLKDAR